MKALYVKQTNGKGFFFFLMPSYSAIAKTTRAIIAYADTLIEDELLWLPVVDVELVKVDVVFPCPPPVEVEVEPKPRAQVTLA